MKTEIGSKRIKELLPLIATIIAISSGDVIDVSNVDCNAIAVDSVRGGITLLDDDDWRVALAIYYATLQQGNKLSQYGGRAINALVNVDGVKFGTATFEQLVMLQSRRYSGYEIS